MTQSEMGQKQKLREVLDMVNHLLNLTPSWVDQKWSVDSTFTAAAVVVFCCIKSIISHSVMYTSQWSGRHVVMNCHSSDDCRHYICYCCFYVAFTVFGIIHVLI